MLLRNDLSPLHRIALGHVRQDGPGFLVVVLVVMASSLEREEAV